MQLRSGYTVAAKPVAAAAAAAAAAAPAAALPAAKRMMVGAVALPSGTVNALSGMAGTGVVLRVRALFRGDSFAEGLLRRVFCGGSWRANTVSGLVFVAQWRSV